MRRGPEVAMFLTLVAAGFAVGRLARPSEAMREGFPDAPMQVAESMPGRTSGLEIPARVRSTDTVADLLGLPDGELYGRPARWLMDASAEEIGELWKGLAGREGASELKQLVLLTWTRVDPQAAVEAVKGTDDEPAAWGAWACHDPAAALAAAENAEQMESVARGIGTYRPEWFREHAAGLTDEVVRGVVMGLESYPSDRPEEDLDWVQRASAGTSVCLNLFSSFANDDPWAARRWLEVQQFKTDFAERLHWEALIDSLATVPEATARTMIDSMKEGRLKRKADLEWFERRLEADPEAALAELEEGADGLAPVTTVMRKAAAGKHLLETDPEAAFAIVEELFGDPAVDPASMSQHPNGSDNEVSDVLDGFVSYLMQVDPARTLDLLLPEEVRGSPTFNRAAMDWAIRDPDAVGAWLVGIDNTEILDSVGADVIMAMTLNSRFGDAMDWAMATDANLGEQQFSRRALQAWVHEDPEGARAWVASLPEEQRTNLESHLAEP